MNKKIKNNLNINLAEMMREETGQAKAKSKSGKADRKTPGKASYRHCSFICAPELWDKAQAIANKEGFSIREVMEHWIRAGIASYEAKHGEVAVGNKRSVDDVL